MEPAGDVVPGRPTPTFYGYEAQHVNLRRAATLESLFSEQLYYPFFVLFWRFLSVFICVHPWLNESLRLIELSILRTKFWISPLGETVPINLCAAVAEAPLLTLMAVLSTGRTRPATQPLAKPTQRCPCLRNSSVATNPSNSLGSMSNQSRKSSPELD